MFGSHRLRGAAIPRTVDDKDKDQILKQENCAPSCNNAYVAPLFHNAHIDRDRLVTFTTRAIALAGMGLFTASIFCQPLCTVGPNACSLLLGDFAKGIFSTTSVGRGDVALIR